MRELRAPTAAEELKLKFVRNDGDDESTKALATRVRELEQALKKSTEAAQLLERKQRSSKGGERRLRLMEEGQRRLERELIELREAQKRSLEGRFSDVIWRQLGRAYKVRRELRPRSYEFDLEAKGHAKPETDGGDGAWNSLGPDPQFRLTPRGRAVLPYGHVRIRFDFKGPPNVSPPVLHFDLGHGFNDRDIAVLPEADEGRVEAVIRLPEGIQRLRLDPFDGRGTFMLKNVRMSELALANLPRELLLPWAKKVVHEPERIPAIAARTWRLLRKGGLREIQRYLADRAAAVDASQSYGRWVLAHDILTDRDTLLIRGRVKALKYRPTLSVILPTWNTPEEYLRRAIDSVRAQLYPHWELCIADDASSQPHVRKILAQYATQDTRIKFVVREQNGHISEATNSALQLATGEFVTFLDHDDELTEHALYMMAEELNAHRDADVIYSDEDKIDEEGRRFDPAFKPEWSPDLLNAQNYICHLALYRTSLVREVGGLRKGLEGSQDHDLALRCTAATRRDRIRHVPFILYRWRSLPGSTAAGTGEKPYAQLAGERAVREALEAAGSSVQVEGAAIGGGYRVRYALPAQPEKVSIIIPTRDGYALMKMCIESIQAKTDHPNYEILIVDNQSSDAQALAYFKQLEASGVARVLRYDKPFNYSAINNFAAKEARGELLCLLNNDIEVISKHWLTELASRARLETVGAVGAKLYYPNNTIQHAGVATGLGGVAAHVFKGLPRNEAGYLGKLMIARNVAVVTAACLVVRKKLFFEVGGLNETDLKVAFNDVDFCLKLGAAGYFNVWTPHAELYHHESVSRGLENTPAKQARFKREVEYMRRTWSKVLDKDPFYSPNLSLHSEQYDFAWGPRVTRPWEPKRSTTRSRS